VISRNEDEPLIEDLHPHLRGFWSGERVASKIDFSRLLAGDQAVIFGAMPHGQFQKQLPNLMQEAGSAAEEFYFVDLSADYRLQDLDLVEKYYGSHASPDLIPTFAYGLPELDREGLVGAQRIACPGCFATGLQIGMAIYGSEARFVSAVGITGSTGSGVNPSATTHHPTRVNDVRPYKVLNHQHLAEVDQRFGPGRLHFTPLSGPFARGIFLAFTAEAEERVCRQNLISLTAQNPFLRHVEVPRLATVVGSNFIELAVATNGTATTVTLALDNLVKGMAGQAIQALNIALGLPETEGLWRPARFPG
jgi:N-acetyl-gamma-glutamyl-phosphate reductase